MGWSWEDLGNTLSNLGEQALNFGANTVSAGTVGYDPDEGFTPNAGYASRIINEASGDNKKKEDAYSQRVVDDQKAAQQKLIDDQTEQARQNDVRASSSARAIRRTALTNSTGGLGGVDNSDEKDFLGL